MANWITFAWQIEFVAIAILIYGSIIFLKSIVRLDKDFRMALLFILGSVIINVAFGIMIGVFLTMGVGYNEIVDFWVIRPIITLIVALLVMFGAKKFLTAMKKVGE